MAGPTTTDHALKGILLSNGVTLALALWQHWSVLELMWPFWMQSLIIGWYARQRILRLASFSTDGLTINDRAVDPTPQTQRQVANFFALHYGFFHVIYLAFLLSFSSGADGSGFVTVTSGSGIDGQVRVGQLAAIDYLAFALLSFSFWLTHRGSHREHVASDLTRCPNIGTLMFMPYARVIPMHLTIILAVNMGDGAVWLFVLLKTLADVVMHKVEHRVLAGRQGVAVRGGAPFTAERPADALASAEPAARARGGP